MSHRGRVIARRKKRAKDALRASHRRRQAFDRTLEILGLHPFKGRFADDLPALLARTFPRPRVITVPSSFPDDVLQARAGELDRALDGAVIRIGRRTLSHADYFTTCVGLHYFLTAWQAQPSSAEEREALIDALGRLTAFVDQHDPEMMAELDRVLRVFLARHSRLDGPIYTVRHEVHPEGGKLFCTTAVGRSAPESIPIEVGGQWRRAFRCGIADEIGTGEIDWIAWPADIAGPRADGRLPVYIQGHAILRARERLGAVEGEGFMDYFLARSLREPRVTAGREGQLLIDVKIFGERVGYLVAERFADRMLVKTFLLMTMRGTPEGERLHRRLRMGRSDLQYLKLDHLGVLAFTDLLEDEDIAAIFAEAGCGGLIALARLDVPGRIREGFATRFKSYFARNLCPPEDRFPLMEPPCSVDLEASG